MKTSCCLIKEVKTSCPLIKEVSMCFNLGQIIVRLIMYIFIIINTITPEMDGWEPTMCGWELEVPHKLKLRGYAVTPLCVCYCINKYTPFSQRV